ncbi:uncharacterized protein LOC127263364 [Andrographis paniculata]|uniref:uncharacterized protein LOC127263364 n=1 Tax=Andrographis paniculata TaxID=175694 RepID=UPI0021E96DC1|nr:uncharacterized protein LOC127263364 [Andrographis paniculata]
MVSALHDSIASICKTILPTSFRRQRRPAIAAGESKQQSDNLKWQQDSFHNILNLMELCKEGIVPTHQVSAFRSHLLETLIAAPPDREPPPILRDKLLFLQELLFAGCISEVEYHASKRPLLQRLAVQGAEIEARDVILGERRETVVDEWSVIDLKDDVVVGEPFDSKIKQSSAVRRIKGAALSAFGLSNVKKSESKSIFAMENLPLNRDGRIRVGWLMKWKKNGCEDDSIERGLSSYEGKLVENPIAEGPDTTQIKRKLNPDAAATDFFVDKVLGKNVRKELRRIRLESKATDLTDDQIEAISTRLPVDKKDLKNIFPKTWCDKYGEIALDVVRREFKEHTKQMGSRRRLGANKHVDIENSNPNLVSRTV